MRVAKVALGGIWQPLHRFAIRVRLTPLVSLIVFPTSIYFGQELHTDRNKKVVMFGVTHYAAIYGYSKMVIRFQIVSVVRPNTVYCKPCSVRQDDVTYTVYI